MTEAPARTAAEPPLSAEPQQTATIGLSGCRVSQEDSISRHDASAISLGCAQTAERGKTVIAQRYQTRAGIQAVVFWDESAFVAICLERDIATQGKTIDEVCERLETALAAHVMIAHEKGWDWFGGIGPSPAKYHRMWDEAPAQGIETRRAETSEAQAPSRSDESPVPEGHAP